MLSWKGLPSMLGTVVAGPDLAIAVGTAAKSNGMTSEVHFDLSLSGGGRQNAAVNAVTARAAEPPDELVHLDLLLLEIALVSARDEDSARDAEGREWPATVRAVPDAHGWIV